MNIDFLFFCFYGLCTVCEVNFPKRRQEIHLARRAKSLNQKINNYINYTYSISVSVSAFSFSRNVIICEQVIV
jgi:hypothetical protein